MIQIAGILLGLASIGGAFLLGYKVAKDRSQDKVERSHRRVLQLEDIMERSGIVVKESERFVHRDPDEHGSWSGEDSVSPPERPVGTATRWDEQHE